MHNNHQPPTRMPKSAQFAALGVALVVVGATIYSIRPIGGSHNRLASGMPAMHSASITLLPISMQQQSQTPPLQDDSLPATTATTNEASSATTVPTEEKQTISSATATINGVTHQVKTTTQPSTDNPSNNTMQVQVTSSTEDENSSQVTKQKTRLRIKSDSSLQLKFSATP